MKAKAKLQCGQPSSKEERRSPSASSTPLQTMSKSQRLYTQKPKERLINRYKSNNPNSEGEKNSSTMSENLLDEDIENGNYLFISF